METFRSLMEAFWRITRARIRRVACFELVDGCAGDGQAAWTIGLAKRMQVSDLGCSGSAVRKGLKTDFESKPAGLICE